MTEQTKTRIILVFDRPAREELSQSVSQHQTDKVTRLDDYLLRNVPTVAAAAAPALRSAVGHKIHRRRSKYKQRPMAIHQARQIDDRVWRIAGGAM